MNKSPLSGLEAAAASAARQFTWMNVFMAALVVTAATGLRESLVVQVALFAVVAGATCAMLFTIHMNSRAASEELEADLALLIHAPEADRDRVAAAAA